MDGGEVGWRRGWTVVVDNGKYVVADIQQQPVDSGGGGHRHIYGGGRSMAADIQQWWCNVAVTFNTKYGLIPLLSFVMFLTLCVFGGWPL